MDKAEMKEALQRADPTDLWSVTGGPSDQELANQYREELTLALQNVMEILGRARRRGLVLGFTLAVDQSGRDYIGGSGITVARYL